MSNNGFSARESPSANSQFEEGNAPQEIQGDYGNGPPTDSPGDFFGSIDEIHNDNIGHYDSQDSREDMVL